MSADAYQHYSAPAGPGRPLLFVFHGTGGDEHQLLSMAETVLPGAGIVAPRGDVSEQGAARFFRRTGEGVYDMDDLARATEKMSGFVNAHVAAQKPSAVLGLGYSNGANILATVIFADPALFEAAVLMHPLIPFQPRIGAGTFKARLLLTAGRNDPISPSTLTDRLMAYLGAAAPGSEIMWHEGGHEVRPEELTEARRFLAPYAEKAGPEAGE
ncbi:alpha/beta hydrolase [Chelativorans salis]|uniref:Alpha/beta hydrolase n=1 Tax=Chelativorans salis TaxID=2978478 RepID=A0ABT2LS31_9HYPH|nr:alpha/beta hydrolase [Chelativorans sp. EGI FJ00035]MCT7377348.1 alpha/beta hydrolase [Chelativorans sp. EGI FJ00035]